MNQGAKQQGIRKIVSAPLSEWRAAFHAAGAGGRNVGAQASPDLQSRNTNFNDCRTRGAASFVLSSRPPPTLASGRDSDESIDLATPPAATATLTRNDAIAFSGPTIDKPTDRPRLRAFPRSSQEKKNPLLPRSGCDSHQRNRDR
jgi:hypothetical protein